MAEPISLAGMRQEKKAVAFNSIVAAVGITALKVIVGVSTGSLGILSEAAHSGLDLVAAALTYFSVQVSDKPADADHQYGHGKFESFSAFLETGLLLLTCVWIVYEATRRIFFHSVDIEPTLWAFVVMGISIALDVWRSRRLRHVANKYDSQALHADALHFSTDVWSSSVVILGLVLVMVGRRYSLPWMATADPIAALVVACIVVYVSWRLARQTIDVLLDAAPRGVRSRIIEEVYRVDGVLEVDRVRIRRAGSGYFADVSAAMSRNVTFQRSEQVSNDVAARIRAVLPAADVVVNAVSRASHHESLFDKVRAVATRNNLYVHDISVQDTGGSRHVEQHVELDERLSLKQAHEQVTRLEAEMKQDIPRDFHHPHPHRERAGYHRDHRRRGTCPRPRGAPADRDSQFSRGPRHARPHLQARRRPPPSLPALHHAGRSAARAGTRCPDRARRPLSPGSPRALQNPHPSRAPDR